MPMNRILLTVVALAILNSLSAASPTATPVRAEIDALLARLQTSGCQFNRNGSWYSGAEAQDHLLRKFEYLEKNGAIQSAEQFIELAASGSSLSGKPYQVRCGSESPVESRQWLIRQLSVIRSSSGQSKP